MKRTILIIYLFLLGGSLCKGQSEQPQESVLAKVGNAFISEKEFLERFELVPSQLRNRGANLEESKLLFLYSLIAEKLLAQEALAKHLDTISAVQQALFQLKKDLVRDQLYREQILGKIHVSRTEIQKAIPDAMRALFVSYMYFEDSSDASFIKRQLANCKNFDQFQIDTSLATIRDTATILWGEAEAPIEQAAFRLKKGGCSPVIQASTGYYILHVEKEWQNPYFASMDPNVLYERVGIKLRLRKEKARLDEYLATAFHEKNGFSIPGPFQRLAHVLSETWKDKTSGSEEIVSDSLLEILYARCKEQLQDSMVVVGNSFWTVEDVLNKLWGKIFIIDNSRTTGIAAQLNNQLLVLVQQELLAEEGLARHLDERSSMNIDLGMWRQQVLSRAAIIDFKKNVQVSDQDVFEYLSRAEPTMQYPLFQIRELHTTDIKSMDEALQELRSGGSFEKIIRQKSTDSNSAQSGGLTGLFSMNTRFPLGIIAWQMNIGERRGPIPEKNGYIYFELVKKEYPSGVSDSAFSATLQRNSSYARLQKQKKLLDSYIAQCAQEQGYTIFADRLKMLKVSTVPMMTYRILGFGGKMFAAPFVNPQIDWMDEENPKKNPLP